MMNSMILALIAPENAEHFAPTVDLSSTASENTYEIANWLMDVSHTILDFFGLAHNSNLYIWIYTLLVLVIAFGVGYVVKWCILGLVDVISKHLKADLYTLMVKADFFRKLCKIVPPIVFLIFIQFTLYTRATLSLWLTRITWIYVIFTVITAINSLVDVIWKHLDTRENKRRLPLNGVVQLIKGIFWIIGSIVVVAILVNKSPGSLLAGLGVFASVLMLIFKDSILGVVAGVQLSENDSLHVGDWIKVHGTEANGNVIEVSLTSVKIQNFDKTVTTVPPYNLVSGSFTNYRPMQESNTRRIDRCLMIDADSVLFLTDEMLEEFKQIPLMKDYITKKMEQRDAGKVEDVDNSAGLVNGTIETNMGLFRAYVQLYLEQSDLISHQDTCFVSTLEQTSGGIPVQIYAFTRTSAWISYECIQDTIFEHLTVMLYKFGLYLFENASGRDEILNGYLETGYRSDVLFGLPFPLYRGSLNPRNTGALPSGVRDVQMAAQAEEENASASKPEVEAAPGSGSAKADV